jgi:tetratricopeptide (TPR) repeat protein
MYGLLKKGNTYIEVGKLQLSLGCSEEAIEKLSEAMHVFHDMQKFTNEADTLYSLAEAKFGCGHVSPAIEHAKCAMILREKHLSTQHPDTIKSYHQVARIVLSNYVDPDYAGPITAVVKDAFETAIWCYERIFRFLKTLLNPADTKKPAQHTHQLHSIQQRKKAHEDIMGLIRQIVDLKLKLASSNLKETIRLTRVQALKKGYPAQDIKDVILKLIHLTPSVFIDGIFQRLQQGESCGAQDLSILLQLVESSNINISS